MTSEETKKVSFECAECHNTFEVEDPNGSLKAFLDRYQEEAEVTCVFHCDGCEEKEKDDDSDLDSSI